MRTLILFILLGATAHAYGQQYLVASLVTEGNFNKKTRQWVYEPPLPSNALFERDGMYLYLDDNHVKKYMLCDSAVYRSKVEETIIWSMEDEQNRFVIFNLTTMLGEQQYIYVIVEYEDKYLEYTIKKVY
jgi:hypothetical protein